jgi:hypothetical protein
MATVPGVTISDILLKQGDTFLYSFEVTDANGDPLTGIANRFKSQVKSRAGSKGTIYSSLTVTEDSATPGTYVLKSGVTDGVQDTQSWTEGTAVFDIQYTDGDVVRSTYTIQFTISGDVTA